MWVIALLFLVPTAAAPAAYELTWYTSDGGGATFSSGGGYTLGATIGQADAGKMSSATYSLTGGFWLALAPGDCDQDGDVDLDDFAEFEQCLLGPGGGIGAGCNCFDLNDSGDVDLLDFGDFQTVFTG
jgi:hypothetical protein